MTASAGSGRRRKTGISDWERRRWIEGYRKVDGKGGGGRKWWLRLEERCWRWQRAEAGEEETAEVSAEKLEIHFRGL